MRALLARLGFLRTRFGRRTLLSFLGAALLPAAVAAGFGIVRLRSSLEREAGEALGVDAKSAAVSVLERLTLLTDQATSRSAAPPLSRRLEFSADAPATELTLEYTIDSGAPHRVPLDLAPLWRALGERLDGTDEGYCVFALDPYRRLHCSAGVPLSVEAASDTLPSRDADGDVRRVGDYLVVARDIFLRHEYDAPAWRIVLVRSTAPAAVALRRELRSAALAGLIALIVAFILSHVQLRRDTAPIEALQRASRALSDGQLEARVTVERDDEFGELGGTFNRMAASLQRQLHVFAGFEALDAVALRAPGSDALVASALPQLGQQADAVVTSIVLLDTDAARGGLRFITAVQPDRDTHLVSTGSLSAPCRAMLLGTDAHVTTPLFLRQTSLVDPSVAAWWSGEVAEVLIVPLRHDTEALGAVVLGLRTRGDSASEAVQSERRLAERLALGLANARLLSRLEALSLGTLRAFGSAIDANSRWTAGHSARVTEVAALLAETLGVSERECDTLRRGCLLHDIGKVGIPAAILDKPTRLTDDEIAIVQQHPVIGADILSPIAAFAELLPIVRSHHERYDGTGYPDRLAGENIPRLARIAAVADVFDALTSERPYRSGLSIEIASTRIDSGRASHFDPIVVDALLALQHDPRLAAIVHGASFPAIHPSSSDTDEESDTVIFDAVPEPFALSPVMTR